MIEFIEINGQKHPIIVNFYVIGLFQKETGETLSSLANMENKLFLVEPLMWYALKVGYIVSKKEIPFTREDMPVILSDNDIYAKFTETMSKFFPTVVEDVKTTKKKKV